MKGNYQVLMRSEQDQKKGTDSIIHNNVITKLRKQCVREKILEKRRPIVERKTKLTKKDKYTKRYVARAAVRYSDIIISKVHYCKYPLFERYILGKGHYLKMSF